MEDPNNHCNKGELGGSKGNNSNRDINSVHQSTPTLSLNHSMDDKHRARRQRNVRVSDME